MSRREVPEWIGATPDTATPPRVKLRVWNRYGGVCQICFTRIPSGPEYDHRVAIANGGENRETNLWPVHPKCHRIKSRDDLATKAADYKTQLHHLGIKKPRRPMPGSRASPFKRRMDGTVERRRAR